MEATPETEEPATEVVEAPAVEKEGIPMGIVVVAVLAVAAVVAVVVVKKNKKN